jgi:hypothetical protein
MEAETIAVMSARIEHDLKALAGQLLSLDMASPARVALKAQKLLAIHVTHASRSPYSESPSDSSPAAAMAS